MNGLVGRLTHPRGWPAGALALAAVGGVALFRSDSLPGALLCVLDSREPLARRAGVIIALLTTFIFSVLILKLLRECRRDLEAMERSNRDLESALVGSPSLRGLLPICSACKMIRDGEGRWIPVELYIEARSNVLFTHSICPACAQSLYPSCYRPVRKPPAV